MDSEEIRFYFSKPSRLWKPPNKTFLITATPTADVAIAVQDCTTATPTAAAATEEIIIVLTFIKLYFNY